MAALSPDARRLIEADPDFKKMLAMQKGESVEPSGQPAAPPRKARKSLTVGDVHQPSATGGRKKKPRAKVPPPVKRVAAKGRNGKANGRGKPTTIGIGKLAGADDATDYDAVIASLVPPPFDFTHMFGGPSGGSFAGALAEIDKRAPRQLNPHPNGGAHVPFSYDPNFFANVPPEQTRRMLSAITDQEGLPRRSLPLSSLSSAQPRVSPTKVEDMRRFGFGKPPLVVRLDGKNVLLDGNHRAAAAWLDGEREIEVAYCRLAGDDPTLLKGDDAGEAAFRLPFKVAKIESGGDKQLVFGWASIVQQGDYLIVDKQGDVILPEDLEDAAYDFVLEARKHGEMHEVVGTGRLVESMVFTAEKQAALNVAIKDETGQQIVGWWVGFRVDDPEVWKRVKSGELPEFSIGGYSSSVPMD